MVTLRPWEDEDFWILEQCNTKRMTQHLGGPETAEALLNRHHRYVNNDGAGGMYVIMSLDSSVAGFIGFWEHSDDNGTVWESGWAVLPEQQGKGVASAAIQALIPMASAANAHRSLHAYPSVENTASNTLCQKVGFTLIGRRQFEYPKGQWMTCNDWSLDLV